MTPSIPESKAKRIAVWITGLPGSGKSAYADALKKEMPDSVLLRMDEMRKVATPSPSYSESERDILYRSMVYAAKLLAEAGSNVIMDATGNLRKWRELARTLLPGYIEIYLKCPLDVCMEREKGRENARQAPKNIYEKAKEGWPVPGVNVPYEEPVGPEIEIDTSIVSISEGIETIKKRIIGNRSIP